MMEDTLDMDEDEELEEEADAEVDKILFELTDGKLGLAGSVATGLPVSLLWIWLLGGSFAEAALPQSQDKVDDEETERNMEQYRQQLNGLLSS
jgi:charged multivesicular body protein 3